MRDTVATVTGIAVLAISLHLIRFVAALFGIVPEVELPYPVERRYGRYFDEIVDTSDTLFGLASFACAAALGITAGYAAHRRSIYPWKTRDERSTARAWMVFLAFLLPYSGLVQVFFGTRSSGSWMSNFVVDVVTHGVPLYVAWRVWNWWKVAQTKAEAE